MAPSRGYNLASGDSFCMKPTQDIEQKLEKMMKNLIWVTGWFYLGYKDKMAVLDSTRERDCH